MRAITVCNDIIIIHSQLIGNLMVPYNTNDKLRWFDWRKIFFNPPRNGISTNTPWIRSLKDDSVHKNSVARTTVFPFNILQRLDSFSTLLKTRNILCKVFLFLLIILFQTNVGVSQNLFNSKTITNTGTLKIGNQIVGLPTMIDGTIELIGPDQVLPAQQYQHIRLSGTGTKTTRGGNLTITGNLTIATPVTLNITKGNVISLGDTLFEFGKLKGAIQKYVDLSGRRTSSNFGNIGATINWSSKAPGITNVLRVSDAIQTGNGNESIKRYYNIQPNDATAVGNIELKFSSSELNGHNVSNLQLWQSTDNGINWKRHIPVVDTLLKTISKSNVYLNGRWAIADTVHALGPLEKIAGVPANIANMSSQTFIPIILSTLDTFKVLITDIFGTPLNNVPLKFAIKTKPTPTAGGTLSDTDVVTNSLGIASTVLTLGNKVGLYEVTATTPTLDTLTIPTFAKHGIAQSLASVAISLQSKIILSQLDSLFTVEVTDIGENLVDSAMVIFTIDSIPSIFASGYTLSTDSIRTDAFGRASTRLTLGSKVGMYGVNAKVTGVSDSARFFAKATAGAPAILAELSGNNQTKKILKTLDSAFTVSVKDIGENSVGGATVLFTIATTPPNSTKHIISNSSVITDSLGHASTILTLGEKVGKYVVDAVVVGLPNNSVSFTTLAMQGSPSSMLLASGNNQIKPILEKLDSLFTVSVKDIGENPVSGVWVKFAIDSIPTNATGQKLSDSVGMTNLQGNASVLLTLGNKTGTYIVNAEIDTVPIVSFSTTATAGKAASLAILSGNNQSTQITTILANELVVHVVDASGNNVSGAMVKFAIDSIPANATRQSLANDSVPSDVNGIARTKLTVGTKVGLYRVKASGEGISDILFTAKATHGPAFAMNRSSGDNQNKPTSSQLDSAFIISLHDIEDNPIPDVSVEFVIASAPSNATGQQLSDSTAKTDSLGNAYTLLTLGDREGIYSVLVKVDSVPTVSFTARGYYLYGDLNNDIEVNVADITSVIDILTGSIQATFADSIKADLNHDGTVDTLDIQFIRNNILDGSSTNNITNPGAFLAVSGTEQKIRSLKKSSQKYFADASTKLEFTPLGMRVNLDNTIPVRGVEMRIHVNDSTIKPNEVNMLSDRAKHMEVFVVSRNNEIRVIAYNLKNTPIEAGEGLIFRIPQLTSEEKVDLVAVVLAIPGNIAVPPEIDIDTPPATLYPDKFALAQNYPNPFNGSTAMQFSIPEGEKATKAVIYIYNALGQKVKTVGHNTYEPGTYTVRWDGTNDNGSFVASGIYFYKLVAGNYISTKKMIYVK